MENNSTASALLAKFAPQMTRTTRLEKVLVLVCGLTVLWGLYALFVQIKRGHAVTGMRDNVVWGVYIVNFIFFIGIIICRGLDLRNIVFVKGGVEEAHYPDRRDHNGHLNHIGTSLYIIMHRTP